MLDYASAIPKDVKAKRPGRLFDRLLFPIAIVAALAAALTSSGVFSYLAGSANEPSWSAMRPALLSLAGWTILLICMIIRAAALMLQRTTGGRFYTGVCVAFAVALSGFFIGGAIGDAGAIAYETGFGKWVARNVNAVAIQQWQATQASSPAVVIVPPAAWSATIASLSPAPVSVELLPDGAGTVLTWGTFGAWGDSRKAFVGPDSAATPPALDLYDWTPLVPGVQVALQYAG